MLDGSDPRHQLVLSTEAGLVRRGDHELHLTLTEFRLLCELADAEGRVLSRQQLLERVWDHGFFGDERLVDVHVRRLRTKVEIDPANPQLHRHRARAGVPARPAMTVRLTRLRPRSLRARTILYIGAGTMLVAVVFAVATYLLARSYLLDQRVQGVQRRAAIDARLMTSRLETPGTDVA